MDSMEEKLNSVLANPDMMRQIMQMAQTLGKSPEPAGESEPIPEPLIRRCCKNWHPLPSVPASTTSNSSFLRRYAPT